MYGVGQSPPRRRGPIVIIGIIVLALVLLGLFYGFYALVLREDTETASPTPEVVAITQTANPSAQVIPSATSTTSSVAATATTVPTIRPTNTPKSTATLRPPPDVITTGVRARVNISPGLAINLRDLPTLTGSTVITQLVADSEVNVVDGPEDEGDLRWWNVNGGEGRIGWVVESYGGETWLVALGWSDGLPSITVPTLPVTPTVEAPEVTPTLAQTATPTLVPTATAEITPTATLVLTPTVTSEGGIPSPAVGGRARISTKYQFVNLREGPGLGATAVGQLEDGIVVTILEGPEELDGIRWWKVDAGQEKIGWAAEAVGVEVLLVPVP